MKTTTFNPNLVVSAAASLEALSLSDDLSDGSQTLVVDGLNYLKFFCPNKQKPSQPWMLVETMRVRTKGFVRACTLAGFSKTVFVVDKGYASAEND